MDSKVPERAEGSAKSALEELLGEYFEDLRGSLVDRIERLEAARESDRESIRATVNDAVRQGIDSIAPRLRDLDSLIPLNQDQKALLEEARDERIRRATADSIRHELEAKIRQERAEAEALARERRSFWIRLAAIAVASLTPLCALLGTYLSLRAH